MTLFYEKRVVGCLDQLLVVALELLSHFRGDGGSGVH